MPKIKITKKKTNEQGDENKIDPAFFKQEKVSEEEILAKQYKKEKAVRLSTAEGLEVKTPSKGFKNKGYTIQCENPSCFYKGLNLDAKSRFYRTIATIDGYYHVCKDCIENLIKEDYQNGNLDNLYQILKGMNVPFNKPLWEDTIADCIADGKIVKQVFPKYLKRVTSGVFKDMVFSDDQFNMTDPVMELETYEQTVKMEQEEKKEQSAVDLRKFWGNFTKAECEAMQTKFDTIMSEIPNASKQRIDLIKTAVIYRVKEEMAIVNNEPLDVIKKWGDMANKAYSNAKLQTTQMDDDDLKGINSFSEMARKLEEVYDVVQILPEFMYRPNDAVDFVLWELINYVRGLRGMKDCRYEEIWQFYDIKKQDYIRDTGDPFKIFEADPTKMNRNLVQRFLKGTYEKQTDD